MIVGKDIHSSGRGMMHQVFEVLSKNNEASKAVHFPEVNHGFFNRGDVTDVVIKREVLRCYAEMEAYLMEHMQ